MLAVTHFNMDTPACAAQQQPDRGCQNWIRHHSELQLPYLHSHCFLWLLQWQRIRVYRTFYIYHFTRNALLSQQIGAVMWTLHTSALRSATEPFKPLNSIFLCSQCRSVHRRTFGLYYSCTLVCCQLCKAQLLWSPFLSPFERVVFPTSSNESRIWPSECENDKNSLLNYALGGHSSGEEPRCYFSYLAFLTLLPSRPFRHLYNVHI